MLKDIGPLQIEKKYIGKEILGNEIEVQNDWLGTFLGSGLILFGILEPYIINSGWFTQGALIVLGIILLLVGNEKREVERRFGAPEPPHRRVSSRNPFETLKIPTSGPIVDVKYERVGGHRPEGKRIESEVRLPSFLR